MVTKVEKNIELKNGFRQVCVWQGTVLTDKEISDLVEFFKEDMDTRVQYLESIETLPDRDRNGAEVKGTGGRHDVFFAVHNDDVMSFAIKRIPLHIRWIEDVLGNEDKGYSIYPGRVKDYCSWDYFGDEQSKGNTFDQEKDENSPITSVRVSMSGEDGNAFAVMGRVKNAMRKAGVDKKIIDAYLGEAMGGDYDNLIAVTMKYVVVDGDEE